jgi:hypothetical protein
LLLGDDPGLEAGRNPCLHLFDLFDHAVHSTSPEIVIVTLA